MKIRLIWLPEFVYNLAFFSGIYTPVLLYLYVIGHFQNFTLSTYSFIFRVIYYNTLFSMIFSLLSGGFLFLNGRYNFLELSDFRKTERRIATLCVVFCLSLVVYILTKTIDVWSLPTGNY